MKARLLIGALVFAAALWGVLESPQLLVDPGPLVAGHAEIAGDCLKCHTLFLGPRDAKCVACHKPAEIGLEKPKAVPFHQHLVEEKCLACHPDHLGQAGAGAAGEFGHRLLAAGVRSLCHDCHKAPPDVLHRGLATGCKECHETAKWVPATLDHTRYFRFDRDHPADCATCHPKNAWDRYTCYDCHEHSPANVREEHLEEGIREFETCTNCHRSADEDEAERIWRSLRRGGALPDAGGFRRGGDHDDDDDDDDDDD